MLALTPVASPFDRPWSTRNLTHRLLGSIRRSTGWPATVRDVEYQGTYVLLGLQLDGDAATTGPLSVMLPEATFVQHPYAPGDRVDLSWDPALAHALAA